MPVGLASRPWRRFLRFSVRGLIVLVLVFGAGLGWLVRAARIQRDAVAALEKAGHEVGYDWQREEAATDPDARSHWPEWPEWLRDRIGLDYLCNVVEVGISRGGSDADLLHAVRLSRLVSLSLSNSSVTDAGLQHLRRLSGLEDVRLDGTEVSDIGLAHLSGLKSIRFLWLGETRVSDAGLAHLERLFRVETLHIEGTRVSDAGLAHLKELNRLGWLNLTDTQVGDAGLVHLKALNRLYDLPV